MVELVDQILLFASTEDRKNGYLYSLSQSNKSWRPFWRTPKALVRDAGFTSRRNIEPGLPAALGDLAELRSVFAILLEMP